MKLPTQLATNAWAGGTRGISGPVGPDAVGWAKGSSIPTAPKWFLAGPPADPRNWGDKRVGWGLILPENENISEADRATGADAPPELRELLDKRGNAPVLRFQPKLRTHLVRYYVDREREELDIAGTGFGTEPGRMPRYLLIYGSPSSIPWDLQFTLNARFAVGRLDLAGPPLENYVRALLSGWSGSSSKALQPVVWATELNARDVSAIMKAKIANPLYKALAKDPDIGANATLVDSANGGATAETLTTALTARVPGLIVTTSHGKAGNAGQNVTTRSDLGLLVGEDESLVSAGGLESAGWQPDGAIWYSHACCSAGSSSVSVYDGLFAAGTQNDTLVTEVAALGDSIAPLPQALLGHERPLRAFVGHVEPTFSWTIQNPINGLSLASGIRAALYDCLYQANPVPIGLALWSYYASIGEYASELIALPGWIAAGTATEAQLLAVQLGARDRMSTVILGDPTVSLDLSSVVGGGGSGVSSGANAAPNPASNCDGI
jgi:hypothetical protein